MYISPTHQTQLATIHWLNSRDVTVSVSFQFHFIDKNVIVPCTTPHFVLSSRHSPLPAMSLLGTQDPLVCLGTDLFVDILSHLDGQDLLQAERVSHCWHDCSQAFSSGLWRRAALRAAVEPSDVYACDSLATEGRWTVDEHDRRPVVDDVGRLLDPPTIRHWATRSVDSPGPAFLQLTSTPLDTPLGESVRVNWRYVCESLRPSVRRRCALTDS